MALSSLLSVKKRPVLTIQETQVSIEFDASVSEDHQSSSEATTHAVETGFDPSDHIKVNPDVLNVNVIVSNDPILILASERATPIAGFSDPQSRAEDAVRFLRQVKNKKQLVDFSTTLESYKNLYIQSIGVQRDAGSGNIANINLALKVITIATTEYVDPPEPKDPARKQKSSKGKKTKTPSKPSVAAKAESSTSVLVKLFGS